LRDVLWHDGTARGQRLAAFVEQVAGPLTARSVLDLGCAAGGITRVLAQRARRGIGLDSRRDNVWAARHGAGADGAAAARFAQGDALHLPFGTDTFDVVLMSGLVEWLGWALPDLPPAVAQLTGLREVRRVLRPGGWVFVGIENRWFPRFLLRSPHQRLPLALLLPARVAWALPRWVYGARVHERLYGPRGLERLLRRAGFEEVEIFIPVFDYQFPREIVPGRDRRALLAALGRAAQPARDDFERVTGGGRRGRRWLRLVAALGLQRWLAPCFVAVGRVP